MLRLSCVAGFSNMSVFIAGEISFGHVAARTVVVSMLSAMPCASLAIVLAVAGAMSMRSAAWLSSMCSVGVSFRGSNTSVTTLPQLMVSKVRGDTNFAAFSVMTTRTS